MWISVDLLLWERKSASGQHTSYHHNLSVGGADNPSSRSHLPRFASRHAAEWFPIRQKKKCSRNRFSHSLNNLRFLRLQRDQRLTLWYIGKRKQGFLRNHAIPQFTFLTPVGNRCITPCVCVKEPARSRGVILTAGGLYVHKGTVVCRNIRRHIQR